MMFLNSVISQVNIQIFLALLIAIELKATCPDVSFFEPVCLDMIVLKIVEKLPC